MNEELQFQRGIEEFNRGQYFECHDTLEELWMETNGRDRLFLQGLIQVSVGFYHFFNGNYNGAASQFAKGLEKLDGYRPVHRGIELENFVRQSVVWCSFAERALVGKTIDTKEILIPKLVVV